MLGSVARFALTGGAATLVHLSAALVLIHLGAPPLIANVIAFLIAFMVSFWGHSVFTFAGHGLGPRQSLQRFAIVAGLGFMANETSLAALLKSGIFAAGQAVFLSTLIAAICTFVLSRYWAFSSNRRLGPDRRGRSDAAQVPVASTEFQKQS